MIRRNDFKFSKNILINNFQIMFTKLSICGFKVRILPKKVTSPKELTKFRGTLLFYSFTIKSGMIKQNTVLLHKSLCKIQTMSLS